MIIYNVTTKVDFSIQNEWLVWLKEEQIPRILNTGCFTSATILQLLDIDDSEGPTFAVQYFAASKAFYNGYIEKYSRSMQQKTYARWGDKILTFGTVMKVVN